MNSSSPLLDEFREAETAYMALVRKNKIKQEEMSSVARENQVKIAILTRKSMEVEKEIKREKMTTGFDIYNDIFPEDKEGFEMMKEEVEKKGQETRINAMKGYCKSIISDYANTTTFRLTTEEEFEAGLLYELPKEYNEIIDFLEDYK